MTEALSLAQSDEWIRALVWQAYNDCVAEGRDFCPLWAFSYAPTQSLHKDSP